MTKTPYEIELEGKLMKAWSETVLSEFQRKEALAALMDLSHKVHSGYDFNADPECTTMKIGKMIADQQAPNRNPHAEVLRGRN